MISVRVPKVDDEAVVEEVVFLGSGTSSGVPYLSCLAPGVPYCETCTDALRPGSKNRRNNPSVLVRYRPAPQSRVSAHLVADDGLCTLLIDCGKTFYSSVVSGVVRGDTTVGALAGVLLTHGHADAILGIDDLRHFKPLQRTVDVWSDFPTRAVLRNTYPYLFSPAQATGGGAVASIAFHSFIPWAAECTEFTDCQSACRCESNCVHIGDANGSDHVVSCRDATFNSSSMQQSSLSCNDYFRANVQSADHNSSQPFKKRQSRCTHTHSQDPAALTCPNGCSLSYKTAEPAYFNLPGGIKVLPIRVPHGTFSDGSMYWANGFSFNNNRLLYISDTVELSSDTLKGIAAIGQPGLFVIDCCFREGSYPSHACWPQDQVMIDALQPCATVLTGMAHEIEHESFEREVDERYLQSSSTSERRVHVGFDGMKIQLCSARQDDA